MLFNSLSYMIFLPIICILYFTAPNKLKNYILLIASFYFYMNWNKSYALLMLTSITITYFSGLLISKESEQKKRKLWVFLSFAINLLILFYFKYFNFILETFSAISSFATKQDMIYKPLDIVLPVGISFYIFQALGYTVDVYRKELPVQKNFFKYALFVSFFPQLVAGPIERSTNLIKQLDTYYKFDFERMRYGILTIMWGMFKKVIIADRLAIIVNTVYNNIYDYKGIPILVATVAFAFQIYCDFSAYSDIAIGSAKILGFDLMKNFDAPYFSKSISEFWRRWHISLSTWFRDYLYIPLGGNRKGTTRKYVNLIIVFFISGVWHGAGMNFVVWGLLNGFYQVFGAITSGFRKKVLNKIGIDEKSFSHKLYKILFTFMLTCISFIFFRANTFKDALYGLKYIAYPNLWTVGEGILLKLGLGLPDIIVAIISIIILLTFDRYSRRTDLINKVIAQPVVYRWGFYIFSIVSILTLGIYGSNYESVNFLYFQF